MPDLDVVAVIVAKPGSVDIVGDALRSLVEPTRAEPGCLSYHLFSSQLDPNSFITVERWRSADDLDAHMKSAHIGQALAAAGEHMAAAPQIHPLTSAEG